MNHTPYRKFGRTHSTFNKSYGGLRNHRRMMGINESVEDINSDETLKSVTMPKSHKDFKKIVVDRETQMEIPDANDFVFSHHYVKRDDYPEYLRVAAREHGVELPEVEEKPFYKPYRHRRRPSVISNEIDKEQHDVVDNGDYKDTPEDNFFRNVILGNAEEFNETNYDMECLYNHRGEILKLWNKEYNRIADVLKAAKNVLEKIPGCERKTVIDNTNNLSDKNDEEVDDVIGNIDDGDADSSEQNNTKPFNIRDTLEDGTYGIIVKFLDPSKYDHPNHKQIVQYVTPEEFKRKKFYSLKEAKDVLREIMDTLVKEPDGVFIGVVLDHGNIRHILDGDGFETIENGDKIVKIPINPIAYMISASNKYNTDIMLRREYRNNNTIHCDEYLGENNSQIIDIEDDETE